MIDKTSHSRFARLSAGRHIYDIATKIKTLPRRPRKKTASQWERRLGERSSVIGQQASLGNRKSSFREEEGDCVCAWVGVGYIVFLCGPQ